MMILQYKAGHILKTFRRVQYKAGYILQTFCLTRVLRLPMSCDIPGVWTSGRAGHFQGKFLDDCRAGVVVFAVICNKGEVLRRQSNVFE